MLVAAGVTQAGGSTGPATEAAVLEEIVVTGSRIQQRLEDVPRPVVILNREDIERSAQDSIGKVLQQLPGNTGSPQNTNVNNGGDGSTRVDLRGLGAERTLVLVNGRRFVYGGLGGDSSVDLNMIPLSMIERTEVLGVGSSTVYGADAVGGVVNLITRKDYDGAEVGGGYSITSEQDGDIATVNFVAGQAFERGYFVFGGDAADQAAVMQDDRDYSDQPLYLRGDGTAGIAGNNVVPQGTFRVPGGNALGVPGGVLLIRTPGSGEPTDATDFRRFQLTGDLYNFAPANYLRTPSERQSAWLLGGFDLSDRVSLFVEALAHHRSSEQILAPSPYVASRDPGASPVLDNGDPGIPASNWYNPFRVDIRSVSRRFAETGPRQLEQDVDTRRFVVGANGHLDATWDWEFSATYGRNDTSQTTQGELRADHMRLALGPSGPDAAGRIVCGERDPLTGIVPAAGVIAGCVPLNVFGGQGPDGKGTMTPEMLQYVTVTLHDDGHNEQWVYDLIFHGEWGALAGNAITWAAGATRREEQAANEPDPRKLNGVAGSLVTSLTEGGELSVNELFVETQLPLLEGLPAVEELTLTAGLRYSDFSSFGDVTTWQGGLLYRPLRGLTIRAGYGRVFRAPTIANLFTSNAGSVALPEDPCGNAPTPEQQVNCAAAGVPGGSYEQDPEEFIPSVAGGNPDLQPEEGDTVSAGITLAPPPLAGFSISVDYWRTTLDDVIVADPFDQDIVDACANSLSVDACGRIGRNADGTIAVLDLRTMNATRLEAEGYDFDVGYMRAVGTGQLDSRLMATYLGNEERRAFEESEPTQLAGKVQNAATYPRWRGLAYLAYSQGPWTASYGLQYIDGMKYLLTGSPLPDPYRGWVEVDPVWYQDVNVGYRFDGGGSVNLAVDNVADVDPPRIYGGDANTNTATYRLLGRTYYLLLSYRLH